jgi:pimeloyl-ACP methyl ester carboxylesterase
MNSINIKENPKPPLYFFVHGGPGFNSVSEKKFLNPLLAAHGAVFFWNEPQTSVERGIGYHDWKNALLQEIKSKSMQHDIHLFAHSFAARAIVDLLQQHSFTVSSLSLIAPSFDLNTTFRNILKLAEADFKKINSELSVQISECLTESKSLYDEGMKRGIGIALQDENLFTHYWQNLGRMTEYFATWASEGMEFHYVNFNQILSDLASLPELAPNKFLKCKTTFWWGMCDPVSKFEEQGHGSDFFETVHHIFLEECGHFLHLEEREKFIPQFMKSMQN